MGVPFRRAIVGLVAACASAGCFLVVDFGSAELGTNAGGAAAAGGAMSSGGTGGLNASSSATGGAGGSATSSGGGSSSSGGAGGALTYSERILADGPVAYWRLNESAPPVHDATNSGHEGALGGGSMQTPVLWQQPGVLTSDFAVGFQSASSQYLTFPATAFDFAPGAAFSLEVWAKPTQFAGANGTAHLALFDKEDFAGPTGRQGYALRSGSDGVFFERYIAGTSHSVTAPAMALDIWYHLVATHDTSGMMIVYVNGVQSGNVVTAAGDTSNGAPFNIAAVSGGSTCFIGILDEAAVYDKALSPAQIMAHCVAVNGSCP